MQLSILCYFLKEKSLYIVFTTFLLYGKLFP